MHVTARGPRAGPKERLLRNLVNAALSRHGLNWLIHSNAKHASASCPVLWTLTRTLYALFSRCSWPNTLRVLERLALHTQSLHRLTYVEAVAMNSCVRLPSRSCGACARRTGAGTRWTAARISSPARGLSAGVPNSESANERKIAPCAVAGLASPPESLEKAVAAGEKKANLPPTQVRRAARLPPLSRGADADHATGTPACPLTGADSVMQQLLSGVLLSAAGRPAASMAALCSSARVCGGAPVPAALQHHTQRKAVTCSTAQAPSLQP